MVERYLGNSGEHMFDKTYKASAKWASSTSPMPIKSPFTQIPFVRIILFSIIIQML